MSDDRVALSLTYEEVLESLGWSFLVQGLPAHIRSDNDSEFTAWRVREWLARLQVRTLYIEPGSPWVNGYIESINGKMRDELLGREIFCTLKEARVLIEDWRKTYNQKRPSKCLELPSAPETILVPPCYTPALKPT